jgi:hypothetical protein
MLNAAQFVIAPPPQIYFIDKDTGGPLAGGFVYFYSDNARTTPKAIYELTGAPGSYEYTELPNPVVLSSIGTISNGVNDVQPYYYPYDSLGNLDLYYLVAYSSSMVLQYPRSAWPNTSANSGVSTNNLINYIPNGQLVTHNNVPFNPPAIAGTITQPITTLAPGGFTFERPPGSLAVDLVTFYRFGSDVFTPTSSPRYAVQVKNTGGGAGDGYKDIRIKFQDVNKFSSPTNAPQQYTFGVTGQSNSGSSVSVQLSLIKNFGTGGSIQVPIPLTELSFSTAWSLQQYSFTFGNNTAYTIGTLDDDYLQLALTFPIGSIFDASFTDFILTFGAVTLTSFPITTTGDFESRTMAGWLPPMSYTGSDVYLPIISTPSGLTYDHSVVGKIYAAMYFLPQVGELLCDGSKYITQNYSTDNIPYSRLFNVLFDPFINIPIFGTGLDYLTTIVSPTTTTNEMVVQTNTEGVTANAADGATATGFTFANVAQKTIPLATTAYCMNGYYDSAGTLGFTGPTITVINTFMNTASGGAFVAEVSSGITNISTRRFNSTYTTQVTTFTPPAAIVAGTYFNVLTISSTGTNLLWYVWFKVNGAGTDPAPAGRSGILVNVNSTDSQVTAGRKIAAALNGFQISSIKTVAGSVLSASSYFNIYAWNGSSQIPYTIWYTVDSVGTAPVISNALIEVDVLSTDTAAAVAQKTQIAMNSYSYAVPDLRGQFLRGWNNSSTIDVEAKNRYSSTPIVQGDRPGTFQQYDIQSHNHPTGSIGVAISSGGQPLSNSGSPPSGTNNYGYYETRPYNVSTNFVIKY